VPFVSFELEVKILIGGFRAAYGSTASTEVLALLMRDQEPDEARVLDAVLDALPVITGILAGPRLPAFERRIDTR
jgi:hypothetical protein